MPSTVYFGSARQARLEAKETLPAKLDLILEQLKLRDRVKDETVVIKMHTGNNIGYSTMHPVFVRKVVQAVKDGGGKPFVADVTWDATGRRGARLLLGDARLPGVPGGRAGRKIFLYRTSARSRTSGMEGGGTDPGRHVPDQLRARQGTPRCGFGGAVQEPGPRLHGRRTTRSAMHDTMQFDRYWFADRCPDEAARKRIIAACPHEALVEDKDNPNELHLHPEHCNQCGRCLKVAPAGQPEDRRGELPRLPGSLRHQHEPHAVHLRAGQGRAPQPGHPDDAGLRLLRVHRRCRSSGRRHLRLGRHRGRRPGGPGCDARSA